MNKIDIRRAMDRVSKSLEKKPRESMYYRERAQLHLLLREYHLARSDLDATYHCSEHMRTTKIGQLHSDLEINGIGAAYWMEGHLDLAVSHWRYSVDLHLLNHIRYSDSGVGIRAGLLLWFGAANRKSRSDTRRVEEHFRKRCTDKVSKGIMAGPSGAPARYFLREIDEDQLLSEVERNKAGWQQRHCSATFALAVRAREEGRHKDYYKLMKEAVGSEDADPYAYFNVWEFYIARHESCRGQSRR